MLSGKVHDLRHFSLRHLICENATFPDSVVMDVEHDPGGRFSILVKEPLQHVNHELHGRVVIVQQQDAVKVRPLRLRLGFGDDGASRRTAGIAPLLPVVAQAGRHRSAVRIAYRHVARHGVVPQAPRLADLIRKTRVLVNAKIIGNRSDMFQIARANVRSALAGARRRPRIPFLATRGGAAVAFC